MKRKRNKQEEQRDLDGTMQQRWWGRRRRSWRFFLCYLIISFSAQFPLTRRGSRLPSSFSTFSSPTPHSQLQLSRVRAGVRARKRRPETFAGQRGVSAGNATAIGVKKKPEDILGRKLEKGVRGKGRWWWRGSGTTAGRREHDDDVAAIAVTAYRLPLATTPPPAPSLPLPRHARHAPTRIQPPPNTRYPRRRQLPQPAILPFSQI